MESADINMHNQLRPDLDRPFVGSDRLRMLIKVNPYLLPVLSRFDIALGFGESSVADVCRHHSVDTDTFLVVCNFFSDRRCSYHKIDLRCLILYLKSAHHYFMDYVLPGIRNRLISAISHGSGDFAWMLINFYDQYVSEVRKHMEYEDNHVFSNVMNLLEKKDSKNFTINDFKKNHRSISDKLQDLKELLIGHYTAESGRTDLLNTALFDLMVCERDLMLHCALEDKIFVPAVLLLEQNEMPQNSEGDGRKKTTPDSQLDDKGDIVLTAREKDIVRAIAAGMTNKEIADKLFLSIHTVTTHRRNISAKLNIHSASGLTIYGLMHDIITLDEVSDQIH